MQGRICGKETDYAVSADGDTIYRALPMVKNHGALTIYRPADTSRSVTCFTQKSYPVMMDNRYMWSSVSLGAIVLLAQSKVNSVRRLTGVEALQGVLQNVHRKENDCEVIKS